MIVWLASYPRSGNTLLRTVLHQTMGFGSYSDEIDPEVRRNVGLSEAAAERFGRRELPVPWSEFYEQASASPETVMVKTHHPPRDGQPALYVVRDGRSALASYEKFHRRFQAAQARSLLELVVGHDHYGDWSGHYRSWTGRKAGRILVLRYEELVDASQALLGSIAAFLGAAKHGTWKNPFDQMRIENPGFFEAAKREWDDSDPAWTPFIDALFFRLHGPLMEELGYASREKAQAASGRLGADELALGTLAAALAGERRSLEAVCRERQAVIDGLQRACEERLALIERLSVRGEAQ